MTAMFDTLKFARTLRDGGGFTLAQAEGLADAFSDALSGEVVGRSDLKATEGTLRDEIATVRTELHDGLAAVRSEMADLRTELHDRIAAVRTEIADLRTELKGGIADLRTELKGDIADLRTELKGDIADLRTDIKGLEARIEAARSDTIKWVVGIIGFQTVAIIGAAIVLSRVVGH